MFPLSSASTSGGPGSFPGGRTQTLIPKVYGPLAILPGLACSFPLKMGITGHANTRGHLRDPDVLFLTTTVESMRLLQMLNEP